MIYVAIYLYVMGATVVWWFARSRDYPRLSKAMAVLGWPIVIPVAALWA